MTKKLFFEKTFKGVDKLEKGEYEACVFENCMLSGENLEHYDFLECEFIECDLSGALITNTSFKDVVFKGCKLMGMQFDSVNPFLLEMHFYNCNLEMSIFYTLKLIGVRFKNCNLRQADFTEATISNAVFDDCDLNAAVFTNTDMRKADLSTAHNFLINPLLNRIKGAKFSRKDLIGLITSFEIKLVD